MSIPAIPLRTPMHDAKGNLSRTWILFFQSIQGTSTVDGGGDVAVTINGTPVTY